MATPCMNPDPHLPHPWAIAANPGEDGPDWFQCDGRDGELVRWEAKGDYPLGRVNTDHWVVPETGWYRLHDADYRAHPAWQVQALKHFERIGEAIRESLRTTPERCQRIVDDGGDPVKVMHEGVISTVLVCHREVVANRCCDRHQPEPPWDSITDDSEDW